jgi:ribosomal protein S25
VGKGEIIRDGRGMYRAVNAGKLRARSIIDRFVDIVKMTGGIHPWEVRQRLNITPSQLSNIVISLRERGILKPCDGNRKKTVYELVSP